MAPFQIPMPDRRNPSWLDTELPCPACGTMVAIARGDRVEGFTARCLRCGTESVVTRERIEHTGRRRWILVSPEEEFPEERRA